MIKEKLELIGTTKTGFEDIKDKEKVLDLQDSAGERKFIKTKADLIANTFLTEKMGYNLVLVQKNEETEEEEVKEISIDPACVRTIEED